MGHKNDILNLTFLSISEMSEYSAIPDYAYCTLCLTTDHRRPKDCPVRCPCGYHHTAPNHFCEVCAKRGHLEKDCPVRCPCTTHSWDGEHAYYYHQSFFKNRKRNKKH